MFFKCLMSGSFQHFGISEMLKYVKLILFKEATIFLVFFEVSLHNKKVKLLIFGRILESSKNDPKSIGICPGTLISHFGIIENPKNQYIYIYILIKLENQNTKKND